MILTGNEIRKEVENGNIEISFFDENCLNPNSYNYKLGNKIKKFNQFTEGHYQFDEILLNENGFVLEPHQMYLAHTQEVIGSAKYAMSLIGRSSLGRLGLFLQISANLGHTGSVHQWTLELVATRKLRIYPGMKIGQVSFWENQGEIIPYNGYYNKFNDPTCSKI